MPKYHTYIVNYYDDENGGEFDYFIFHSKTEKIKSKLIKEFRKLYEIDHGVKFRGKFDEIIEDIIEYNPKNYLKAN